METKKYEAEWCLLQNQFESYEKHSLYIKLVSILVLFVSELLGVDTVSVLFILLVLWLQDSIWKTFQSRLEPRLMKIEKGIKEQSEESELQFNRDYKAVATSGIAKILEYAKQAMRPTVAFPHIVLIIIFVARWFVG